MAEYTIGEFLSLCREIKGLSLRDVEKRTGITNAFVSQIETGKAKSLGFEKAVLLCDCYGISVERIADIVRRKK